MKHLNRLAVVSFVGMLLSFGLWWASYWNFDYYFASPYKLSLNHGSVSWHDWRAYQADRAWMKGLCRIGYNNLDTLWKPYFFNRRGTVTVTTVPMWIPAAICACFYYGLSLLGVAIGLSRERAGRCRECGLKLSGTLLCCRKCQSPVSMMTAGRRAASQFAFHGLVLTFGATVISYFNFAATPVRGTTLGLSGGSFSVTWASNSDPGMGLSGYNGFKTVWLPRGKSSIATAAPTPAATPVRPARTLILPLWVAIAVFGYATWRLRFAPANLLRRRRKLGLCLRCGYDLRASKDRCPECGSPFDNTKLQQYDLRPGWPVRFLGSATRYSSSLVVVFMIFVALLAW